MTLIQCILCNQYLEITKKGKDGKSALLNTLLLITVLLTVYIFVTLYFIDILSRHALTESIHTGQMEGSDIGKLLGFVCGGFIFLLLKTSIGSGNWYTDTITKFNGYADREKERIAKRGKHIFLYAFIPLLTILMLLALGVL